VHSSETTLTIPKSEADRDMDDGVRSNVANLSFGCLQVDDEEK
jgi:hypothetical protein